jgi:hypothetical protein
LSVVHSPPVSVWLSRWHFSGFDSMVVSSALRAGWM